MKTMVRNAVTAAVFAITCVALAPLSRAQSAEELSVRMTQMEDQMRQLVGQVEQLTFQVRTLQDQLAASGKSGNAGQIQPQSLTTKRSTVAEMPASAQGIERIEGGNPDEQGRYQQGQVATIITENGSEEQVIIDKAQAPKILGTLSGSEYDSQVVDPQNNAGGQAGTEVETVSLGGQAETPDALYERSYESLLRRQFSDAEVGFQTFLQKYGDNSLAGNAQYWLGETYYVQGDYRQAAQSFLKGYRGYPKSRKAADSLLKLGLSLNRLGQKEQSCAAFAQLGSQFPKAVEARKRAQTEAERAGC